MRREGRQGKKVMGRLCTDEKGLGGTRERETAEVKCLTPMPCFRMTTRAVWTNYEAVKSILTPYRAPASKGRKNVNENFTKGLILNRE